jgi:transposase
MVRLIGPTPNRKEATMAKVECWEVSDEFWKRVEPLIPQPERDPGKQYRRKAGGGRKPLPPRQVFGGIVYVLRTGIQWNALPKELYGSPKAIHRYFSEWAKRGFFLALWQAGLAEYDDMEGIAWQWQSVDGSMMKAPLAQEAVGPNPTDRGKKRQQASSPGGRWWHPAVARRHRGQPQ